MNPAEALEQCWINKDVYSLCKYYFNVDLTKLQIEIVKAVAFPYSKRTTICCMTRYGKSFCVSLGILLWIMHNREKRVALIAPTNEKTSIIRNYIYNFILKSEDFVNLVDIDKTGIERMRKEVSRRRITFRNMMELRTLSAEGQGEQLMGFGADMVVVDEECDIEFEVYRARITRMLGDNPDSVYIGIGNPWHRNNHMWEHWINPEWTRIHIGWKDALSEGRITQTFLDEQKMMLTEREFKVLYDAEFPLDTEDQLIPWEWIQRAIKPLQTVVGLKCLGVDVARGGNDSTVLTYIIKAEDGSYHTQLVEEHTKQDTMQTVGHILKLNQTHTFDRIIVDTSGLGSGVTDRLKEAVSEGRIKAEVIEYEGGRSSSQDIPSKIDAAHVIRTRFLNMKAEAYFRLRSFFEENRISLLKHPKQIDQLSKMKWELTSAEKIRICDPGTKEGDTSEEKSPDFADSLCYACWEEPRPKLIFGTIDSRLKPIGK